MRSSPLGRVLVPVAVFMLSCIVLAVVGIANPTSWALGATITFELIWLYLRQKLAKKNGAREIAHNAKADLGKKIEFDLRFEQAKKNGDLDRFKDKSE